MRLLRRRANFRLALRDGMVSLAAASLGPLLLSALPVKGTPAPPIDSMQLLQAPPGTRADWASLKGKVVILEFWATWCSPCVASIPHLNQLVESLDPAKFQFISIDDEAPKAVEIFLAKKKMAGWVGVDTSGGIVAWYGVKARPTTIIVDGNGKIVAETEVDSVSAADLQAVAQGKTVVFKPAMEITSSNGASVSDAATRPLFAVSVSKAATDAKVSQIDHLPTGTDFLGNDADDLMTNAFNVFENRYVLKDPLPEGRYDLRMNFVDVPESVIDSAVQEAVLSALHVQIQPKTVTKNAYILRATDASKNLLSPSASTHKVKRGYWHGIYILMNGTMDDLAYVLATGLESPVINQTGIDGTFDTRFKITGSDVDSLNAALKSDLGLELIQGNQESSITVLEVSKQEVTNSADTTNRQSPNP
jgi:thiol-disulfide isomerase/thioredoxin